MICPKHWVKHFQNQKVPKASAAAFDNFLSVLLGSGPPEAEQSNDKTYKYTCYRCSLQGVS